MKIKPSLILLVSLIFLFIGGFTVHHFSTNKVQEIEITETLNRAGIIYSLCSEKPFTGRVVGRHEDGSISFYENYEKGKLHGISEYFMKSSHSSRLCARRHHNQGQEIKYERFRDNGILDYVFEYQDGVQIKSTVYNTDGSVKTVSEFNKGTTKIHIYGNSGSIDYTNHFDKDMNKIETTYSQPGK